MFNLKLAIFGILIVILTTSVGLINSLDTTTCQTSGWFYPNTCSPIQCKPANNSVCIVSEDVNMTIIEQSISKMTCNSTIKQSTSPPSVKMPHSSKHFNVAWLVMVLWRFIARTNFWSFSPMTNQIILLIFLPYRIHPRAIALVAIRAAWLDKTSCNLMPIRYHWIQLI